jgi:pimeloyl-ACP methyl ester carboxylesterase
LAGGIIFFLLLHFAAPYLIISVKGDALSLIEKKGEFEDYSAAQFNLNSEKIQYSGRDGKKLRAFILTGKNTGTKNAVILLHGIRAGHRQMLPAAEFLAGKGITAVAADLRAHGESEGKYCTFGYMEKYDIAALADTLRGRGFDNIGIWGRSLGAAVAIQAMELDTNISYGIIESTFSDFRRITYDYSRHFAGFVIPPVTDYAVSRAEKIAGFEADSIVPRKSLGNITRPVFFAHGNNDKRVKIEHMAINMKSHGGETGYIEIDSAGHLDLWEVGGKRYFDAVGKFLDKQLK